MSETTRELLIAHWPAGARSLYDIDDRKSDVAKYFDALSDSLETHAVGQLSAIRAEFLAGTSSALLPMWESALGFIDTSNLTTLQRQARVSARLRESGASTIANIQAALAAILGYTPTILEHSRSLLAQANLRPFPGLPLAIPASGAVHVDVATGDNAPSSPMGAQVFLTVTHPHLEDLEFTLIAPDGHGVNWQGIGSGSVTGLSIHLAAPSLDAEKITGTWQVWISELGGNAGTWLAGASDGIFVEGLGRDLLSGADGLAANIFEWAAVFDPALVKTTIYTNRNDVMQIVNHWNPAHARGYLVSKNSLGGSMAIFDDNRTPVDGGTFDT